MAARLSDRQKRRISKFVQKNPDTAVRKIALKFAVNVKTIAAIKKKFVVPSIHLSKKKSTARADEDKNIDKLFVTVRKLFVKVNALQKDVSSLWSVFESIKKVNPVPNAPANASRERTKYKSILEKERWFVWMDYETLLHKYEYAFRNDKNTLMKRYLRYMWVLYPEKWNEFCKHIANMKAAKWERVISLIMNEFPYPVALTSPSNKPTGIPSDVPSKLPYDEPLQTPSELPSRLPSDEPSILEIEPLKKRGRPRKLTHIEANVIPKRKRGRPRIYP